MTTVTLDTLSNTGVKFIRDVLRNNLTDTQSPARAGTAWIFKDQIEQTKLSYPVVIVAESSQTSSAYTIDAGSVEDAKVDILISVWASKPVDRDTVADQAVSILKDDTKTDGTDSIASKKLSFVNMSKTTDDMNIGGETPEIIRVKNITVRMRYYGT